MNQDKKNELIAENVARYINRVTGQIAMVSDPEIKEVLTQLTANTVNLIIQNSFINDEDKSQTDANQRNIDIKAKLQRRGIEYEFDRVGHEPIVRQAELDR